MAYAPALLNADEIAAKFSESLRTIAKLQGFSEQTVTLAECGVVLKACVGGTKVAKPDAIDNRSRLRALRKLGFTQPPLEAISVNAGIRGIAGFVWWRTKNNKFQPVGVIPAKGGEIRYAERHFKPKDFFKIKADVFTANDAIKTAIPLGQASAGLARQSWVQIADDLGIILEDIPGGKTSARAIQKAREAIASNGRTYQNGIGTSNFEVNKSFFATLKNSLPYNVKIGLDQVMLGVLASRAQFFKQNVQREVFASHSATVRAYPWLKLVGAES